MLCNHFYIFVFFSKKQTNNGSESSSIRNPKQSQTQQLSYGIVEAHSTTRSSSDPLNANFTPPFLLESSPCIAYPITTTRHHFRRRNNHHSPFSKNPQNFIDRFTNFFDPFTTPNKRKKDCKTHILLFSTGRARFQPFQKPESGSGGRISLEFKSVAATTVIRNSASEQFTATTFIGQSSEDLEPYQRRR
ncbi:unnamed protein product [Camellia sinensis]